MMGSIRSLNVPIELSNYFSKVVGSFNPRGIVNAIEVALLVQE